MKSGIDRRFLDVRFVVQGVANEGVSTGAYDQYIVGSDPIGNFAGFPVNSIAYRKVSNGAWSYMPAQVGDAEIINLATNSVQRYNGTEWVTILQLGTGSGGSEAFVDPVEAMVTSGTTLPTLPGDYEAGDLFLSTAAKKLYEVQTDGEDPETLSWDAGTTLADGARYASDTDGKIHVYHSEGDTLEALTLLDGTVFVDRLSDTLWLHNLPTNSFHAIGGGKEGIPMATYVTLGGVVIDKTGGLRVDAGRVKINRRFGVFELTLTAGDISQGSTALPQRFITGRESSTLLSFGGVAQRYGDDFTLTAGEAADYLEFEQGLVDIGLVTGDILTVSYEYDPAID